MLIIILVLVLLLIIIMHEEEGVMLFGGVLFVILFIAEGVLIYKVNCSDGIINEEIAMYEEENSRIEHDINMIVEKYMSYESLTFTSLKDNDGMSLVYMYPELKSDTLISKQIDIYIDNNDKIKELKKDSIHLKTAKWWCYFGH